MKAEGPIEFVKMHGVVLEAARGPVPTLAHHVAGETIRGNWWAHPKAHAIHAATQQARKSPDILTCRAVGGKITFIHKRLWAALIRLAPRLDREGLAAVREIHSASGKHEVKETPFPQWVPDDIKQASGLLSEDKAMEALGDWVVREMDQRSTRTS